MRLLVFFIAAIATAAVDSFSFSPASVLTISWISASVWNDFYHPPNAKDLDNIFERTSNTWVTFTSIMLIYSLIVAAINGEPVGSIFLSQELGFSLILMNVWRYLYATYD
ncbi:hypothetical protein TrVE_jg13654 [Triparma verrucosa]|uniref:Uncharacterized protein n=1 Tax=Triparma verrucosa TaxID=1606542 RepID=A0A9W7CF30_9STRA|nr:hypothetical protein TrVE_jg13654 [Triparma verrucosa]